jgi:hypothetical protein
MAKYYVQSGSFQGIVDCHDEECASVWAIQRVVERSPSFGNGATGGAWCDESMGEAMFAFDDFIQINEQGFDRNDSVTIDLHEAFVHWYQLRKAIEGLTKSWEDRLGE